MLTIDSRQLEEIKSQEKPALEDMRKQLQETLSTLFRDKEIQLLLCTENWTKTHGTSKRLKEDVAPDLVVCELLWAIYPARQGMILRDRESGEVPCAAVVFQKWEIFGDETIYVQDCRYKEKLMRQLEELAVEMESSEYIKDEGESRKIRQNIQFIIEGRQCI